MLTLLQKHKRMQNLAHKKQKTHSHQQFNQLKTQNKQNKQPTLQLKVPQKLKEEPYRVPKMLNQLNNNLRGVSKQQSMPKIKPLKVPKPLPDP